MYQATVRGSWYSTSSCERLVVHHTTSAILAPFKIQYIDCTHCFSQYIVSITHHSEQLYLMLYCVHVLCSYLHEDIVQYCTEFILSSV